MNKVFNGSAKMAAAAAGVDHPEDLPGLEKIPSCSFGNISAIMVKSIENAFYR
jgi:hypothetical protein